jgi:hypothetical protein
MAISERDQAIINAVKDTDEPIIVFRAQDRHSIDALNGYVSHLPFDEVASEFFDAVYERMDEFVAWQHGNEGKVKAPDL